MFPNERPRLNATECAISRKSRKSWQVLVRLFSTTSLTLMRTVFKDSNVPIIRLRDSLQFDIPKRNVQSDNLSKNNVLFGSFFKWNIISERSTESRTNVYVGISCSRCQLKYSNKYYKFGARKVPVIPVSLYHDSTIARWYIRTLK